jgi:hypothetical protein
MSRRVFIVLGLVVLAWATQGCTTSRSQVLQADESAVKLRSIQTRVFDTTDKPKMLRTVMATLQDLGFVVDAADDTIGSVTATKLDRYALKMTVMVRPRNERQLLVRANAQYNLNAVANPEPYQNFFAALEKAIFLTAHLEDDGAPATGPSATSPASTAPSAPAPQAATVATPIHK